MDGFITTRARTTPPVGVGYIWTTPCGGWSIMEAQTERQTVLPHHHARPLARAPSGLVSWPQHGGLHATCGGGARALAVGDPGQPCSALSLDFALRWRTAGGTSSRLTHWRAPELIFRPRRLLLDVALRAQSKRLPELESSSKCPMSLTLYCVASRADRQPTASRGIPAWSQLWSVLAGWR